MCLSIFSFICSRKITSWKIWALEFDHSQPVILSATHYRCQCPMSSLILQTHDFILLLSLRGLCVTVIFQLVGTWKLEHWCGLNEISTSNAMILSSPSFLSCFSIIIIIIKIYKLSTIIMFNDNGLVSCVFVYLNYYFFFFALAQCIFKAFN